MDEFEINYQLPYFRIENAYILSMNLIKFGYILFYNSYLVQNKNQLKNICDNIKTQEPDLYTVQGFAFDNLLDSIRIHILFENFLKACLLSNYYVIHEIDKEMFPELNKKQKTEPVLFSEIIKDREWEINPKIVTDQESLKLQIKGIKKRTLGINILTKSKYISTIKLDSKTLDLFKPYLKYRDNLHYYTSESFKLSNESYNKLMKIIKFINNDVVRIQNILVDWTNKGDEYKIKAIS